MGLRTWLRKRKRKKRVNKILVFIDFENFLKGLKGAVERPSLIKNFDELMRYLGETGRVVNVFVFAPPHSILIYLETFYKLGFTTITCPKIRDKKKGQEIDTVDSTMIDFSRIMMEQIPDLTHLCVVSGDSDFRPLLRQAMRYGLKTIVATTISALAVEVINMLDRDPLTGKKMVYLFEPEPIESEDTAT